MISRTEAHDLATKHNEVLANPRQARLSRFLEELELQIVKLAEQGHFRTVWTVGTNEFAEDILRTLRANGFTASFDLGSFVIEW